MIGLLLRVIRLPGSICMYGGCISAILVFCGMCSCRCRCRDWSCVRRCLRCTGVDQFDSFEVTFLVHEVFFDHKDEKMATCVRVSAGNYLVRSEKSKNGIFQQPLSMFVQQGVYAIYVDLLDSSDRVLARLQLDPLRDILTEQNHRAETFYSMKVKNGGIRNPRVKLTLHVTQSIDEAQALIEAEEGIAGGCVDEVDWLVKQQMQKAMTTRSTSSSASSETQFEYEALTAACAGPLELFEGLGTMGRIYVALAGPPLARRWQLGIWNNESDFADSKLPIKAIDLLRIQSVQADPSRSNVYTLNYFDEHRQAQRLTFRRIDRSRDVWVEILQRVITRAHHEHKEIKEEKRKSRAGLPTTRSRASMAPRLTAQDPRRATTRATLATLSHRTDDASDNESNRGHRASHTASMLHTASHLSAPAKDIARAVRSTVTNIGRKSIVFR